MVTVLEVRAGGQVVVDGSGLYRVTVGEEIRGELLDELSATQYVEAYNVGSPVSLARAVCYSQLAQCASSC